MFWFRRRRQTENDSPYASFHGPARAEVVIVADTTVVRPNGQQETIVLIDSQKLEASGRRGYALGVRTPQGVSGDLSIFMVMPLEIAFRAMILLRALLHRSTMPLNGSLLRNCRIAVEIDPSPDNTDARAMEQQLIAVLGADLYASIMNYPIGEMPDWVQQSLDK